MNTPIKDFNPATCELYTPYHIFYAIHQATAGDPCTTGCAYFANGKCRGYLALSNVPAKIVKSHLLTNSEIGQKLKCSARAVGKRRRAGTLPKEYM